ncbi:putative late blight resistance protein homolog R1A-10 [Salvia splendens]|uniref:putative late blight resistance protein homolog R1A-10 n=1 Tax=Salvia splendens TaxID=180675 RepID=UPI001C2693CC|nr:putative late blight resistance protein homolog R1A-10 [Salvia splendens]
MAYNLQSLITVLQQILHPQQTRWIVNQNKPQLESILEKAESLLQILEKCSHAKIASLESRIRDSAHRVEDIIESRMVHQMLSTPQGVDGSLLLFSFFTPYLEQVLQQLDLEQDLELVTRDLDFATGQAVKPTELESVKLVEVEEKKMLDGAPFSSSKNYLVGVDEDLMQLKDRLLGMERELEIIAIVGMGGIGKSTLARKLCNDRLIIDYFAYRGWASISQDPNLREILLCLLHGIIGKLTDELIECSDDELKDMLFKSLCGRKYMIVLDDIWSSESFDEIRMYFPDDNNGSRIVLTTRMARLAGYASNEKNLHRVKLLDESASWELFCQIVFGEEDCPLELEEIGKNIARNCSGLPLSVHVIGGLLSKVERSKGVWEHFSTDVASSIVESDERLFNILSPSYNYLPIYLKPCFLYMGVFPEHYEIKGSRLIRQWIAQGFVKSNGDKSLEEEAEDYLKALVDRNLLSVTRKKSNGKPLSYSIHDLLWDLCRREANEDSFRCVSFQPSYEMEDEYVSPQLMPHARSFICTWKKNISPMFSTLRLLRVLDVIRMVFEEFPREIIQLVNLRYLAFSCTSGLPIGISRLWYLQTLISAQYVPYVPSELWEMSELRHLKLITKFKIKETTFVHKKLQTLSCVWVLPSLIRSGFFETIPNIRKLGIYYEDSPKIEIDLSYLHKLEKLKCQSALNKDGSRFLHKLRFPCYIGKLTLVGCVVFRSFLTTLRALPNLGVLKIEACVFESEVEVEEEWKLADGDEFCSLRYLCLKDLNLVRWIADETNFPRLEKLIVSGCFKLEEIPSGIGEIPTLQEISLHECEDYLVASVERIMEDQLECGNDDLKVVITH